ncbi:hypothetical protein COV61_04540 [Candidatus Micrarchaeota archaeon CG11_big_fil_rev_8_21_14_0_20_47_5]|nr:MAG: hypothetical protein AUJ17_02955 [Candidatus Micrarchaeota archaeon CG1_02_47_40]PIN82944.1 MAG: hypothetical protein COV61_04540 [Candidatus Micrarchaeota archaeon CG11_big_fil_rev_8_21_14_0_20_47_5]
MAHSQLPNFGHTTKQILGNQSRITNNRHRKRGSHIHPGYEFSRKLGNHWAQKGMHTQEPLVESAIKPEKKTKKAETGQAPQSPKDGAVTITLNGERIGWNVILEWAGEFAQIEEAIKSLRGSLRDSGLFTTNDFHIPALSQFASRALTTQSRIAKQEIMNFLKEQGFLAPADNERWRECIKKLKEAKNAHPPVLQITSEDFSSLEGAKSRISKTLIINFVTAFER